MQGGATTMTLGKVLAEARAKQGWSLREVERRTGIRNAHLSQIENGTIERPDPNILWTLANTYALEFRELMRLAGHAVPNDGGPRRSLLGVALHALQELRPDEQEAVLDYIKKLRDSKRSGIDGGD
jgi:transcriptional regulator with XRE-family HTH domain